ncbi:cyclic lactone autoinducer peptide [Clostridium novyi]|nr:cyclic lactone autoinducer peptide [Clostridium novyi]
MKIMNKLSKGIAKTISKISTDVAYTSTEACVSLNGLEEPKMPKVY